MAIAFHPPEISSTATTPSQAAYYSAPVVHQPAQFGVATLPPSSTGVVFLSPSSAVYQHQVATAGQPATLWLSTPQNVVAQQQMVSGFPPIFHNNTATAPVAAPIYHRVAYSSSPPPPPTRTLHIVQQQRQRGVTNARTMSASTAATAADCCASCNDIRRVYLLLSLMMSNVVYSALRGF